MNLEKIYLSPRQKAWPLAELQLAVAYFSHPLMDMKNLITCLLFFTSMTFTADMSAQITGPDVVCVGQTATFVLDSDPCIADIEWMEIAGYYEIIGPENNFEVDIHFYTATPVIEVCVRYFNTCESKVEEKCHIVEVIELPPTTVEEDLCIGGCTVVAGEQFCDPGVYEVNLTSVQGCDSLVIVILNPVGPYVADLGQIIIGCNDPIEICGQTYGSPGVYSIYCPGNGTCDSIFTVELIGEPVIAEAGPDIELDCSEQGILFGNDSSTGSEFIYLWTTVNGFILNGETTLNPNVLGSAWYYLKVTNFITGCEAIDSVFAHPGGDPLYIEIDPAELSCSETETSLNAIVLGGNGSEIFEWSTTNGNIVSGENTLNPVIDAPGRYCLAAFNAACIDVRCIEVEEVGDLAINGPVVFCFLGEPVTHTVSVCPEFNATSLFLQVDTASAIEIVLAPGETEYEWTNVVDSQLTLSAWAIDANDNYSDTVSLMLDYDFLDVSLELVIDSVTCEGIHLNDSLTIGGNPGTITTEWSTGGSTPPVITQPGSVSVIETFVVNGCQLVDTLEITDGMFLECSEIQGQVLVDENDNCLTDVGEMPLSDWLVAAEGTNGIFYGTTDSDGFYSIAVPPGNYIVTLTPGSNVYDVCSNDVLVALPNANSTTVVHFSVFEKAPCPVMTVDISNNILRRCADNNFFFVKYCNEGTATATDAYVEVTLDPDLTFVFSPTNYTHVGGQLYSFDIGNLDPDECGEFWFQAFLDCDVEIAETHCTEAHIFPDEACLPKNPLWSGASLEVQASCSDSTRFTITNVGSAMVTVPLGFLVIEDAVMYRPGEVGLLAPGESTVVSFPANGSTRRIEVEQEPHHPFPNVPVAWVEGCGDNIAGSFSKGFVNQRFLGDPELYLDTDCTQNQAPFDPNDKQGFPLGYAEDHFVKKENQIEYLIRFQNTGNDTAVNVILLDTLDEKLDLTTLRPGAASHFYEYEIYGTGILKVAFPNINLPDSAADYTGSQGFVQFIVSPNENVLPGDVIENSADIYFDANPPVKTNTTHHTIEKPRVYAVQNAAVCEGGAFNGVTITTDTMLVETINFVLYDSLIFYNLQALPIMETAVSANVCEGESYLFNGETLTQAGTYQADLMAENGCDSTVVLTLSVNENASHELSAEICAGSSYEFYGQELFEEGTYQHLLLTTNGCDSLIELQLSVAEGFETILSETMCKGNSMEFHGQTLSSTGVYEAMLTSLEGCDSLVVLDLEILENSGENLSATICEGDSYEFNGQVLTTEGFYETNIIAANGCDSLVTLDLTFFENMPTEIAAQICEGSEYVLGSQTISNSGEYEEIFTSINGCDSIVLLTLEVTDNINEDLFINICDGDSFEFDGEMLTEEGHYETTTISSEGCDSTTVLMLELLPVYDIVRPAMICYGDSAEFNGQNYFESGIYSTTLSSVHGCDSTVTLDLTVLDSLGSDFSAVICEGEQFDFNGEMLTEPGTYETIYSASMGCDSTLVLYLEVEPVFADTFTQQVQYGEEFNGIPIYSDTVFVENLTAHNGCDSIVTTYVSTFTNTSEKFTDAVDLRVYPNPTDGHFYLQFVLGEMQNLRVEILDVIGQQVVHASQKRLYSTGDHFIEINGSDWAAGVYLVRVQFDNGVVTNRVVVD